MLAMMVSLCSVGSVFTNFLHHDFLYRLHTCRVNDITVMLRQALKLAVPNHALLLCMLTACSKECILEGESVALSAVMNWLRTGGSLMIEVNIVSNHHNKTSLCHVVFQV